MVKHKLIIIWISVILTVAAIFSFSATIYNDNSNLDLATIILAILLLGLIPIGIFNNQFNKKYKIKINNQEIEREKKKKEWESSIKRTELELAKKQKQIENIKEKFGLSEKEILKKMFKVSKRIKFKMMMNALGLEEKEFYKRLFKWTDIFNFAIDGDSLIIYEDGVSDFIKMLDNQFEIWEKFEKEKIGKTNHNYSTDALKTSEMKFCKYCGKKIKLKVLKCPHCSKDLEI